MTLEKLIYLFESEENYYSNRYFTLYHGSEESKTFDKDKFRGIWFAFEKDAEILDYYANRNIKNNIISAKVYTGKCLDLSMYNTDSLVSIREGKEFLTDCELEDDFIDSIVEIFYINTDGGDEWDDEGYPLVAISRLLNYIIPELMKKFDSLVIKEMNDDLTLCSLKFENIEQINK